MAGIVAILDGTASTTNPVLEREWRALGLDARVLAPAAARTILRPGDTALARVDVRATLDGLEPGLLDVLALMRRGVRVLNRPGALLAAHDKLRTARMLTRARLPHPRTMHLQPAAEPPELTPPLVVKPRFGSWGGGVFICETAAEVDHALAEVAGRTWFARGGALVQELVPPQGHDLRVLVAAGRVVGAIRRRARAGEPRTNHSLGAALEPVVAPPAACALAIAAAAATGGDFVGVDLLPAAGGHVVIEVNGAVDFEPQYAPPGGNVYGAIAAALGFEGAGIAAA